MKEGDNKKLDTIKEDEMKEDEDKRLNKVKEDESKRLNKFRFMRVAQQEQARRQLEQRTDEALWVLPGWEHVVENAATIDKTTAQLEEAPCTGPTTVFARRSFGGFNPEVEKRMRSISDRVMALQRRATHDDAKSNGNRGRHRWAK